jgi:hypothetical protein
MKEYYKIKLERHGGCEKCNTRCKFNKSTAQPDKAAETKGRPFSCNSIKN